MTTDTTKLTIRLPAQDVDFAKRYARAHGITVTEVIDRHLRQLQALEGYRPSPELETITGLIPADIDARAEFHEHHLGKHGR